MDKIKELIKELQNMDIEEMVSDALLMLEKKYIALQRGQMKAGKKSDGEQIGNYTSEQYIRKRKKRGLITRHVTLHFTGGYYQSMQLEKRGKEIWITSQWEGQKYLVKRYGIDIYDLNDNQRAKIVEDVANIVSERMLKQLLQS